jgi:chromosome segregation ATPase
MSNKKDFTSMWQDKMDSAPRKTSVIGELKELLQEKKDKIIELNMRVEKLEEDISDLNEQKKLLEQSLSQKDAKLKEQEEFVRDLNVRFEMLNESGLEISNEEVQEFNQQKKLKMQIKALEDKLYVFGALADRVKQLEDENAFLKGSQQLSEEGASPETPGQVVTDLIQKIETQNKLIADLKTQNKELKIILQGDK